MQTLINLQKKNLKAPNQPGDENSLESIQSSQHSVGKRSTRRLTTSGRERKLPCRGGERRQESGAAGEHCYHHRNWPLDIQHKRNHKSPKPKLFLVTIPTNW
ncbi:hypothetical protein M758_UG300600 [Ceratodon purpureus]|nr:hypothetical protein M758_UG300600 [Ceratodon purpureus]